jgi:putative transposase
LKNQTLLSAPSQSRTFFVTSVTNGRRALLQSERMACLLLDVLYSYRSQGRFLLHEFVIMPNHFHLLITPADDVSLEKALQFIKGGFSYRARKELRFNSAIWEAGFTNHRIRDSEDYQHHRAYIHENPVKANLVKSCVMYPYSSAFPGMELDVVPLGLKPMPWAGAPRGS